MGLEFDTEKSDDLETLRQRLAEAAAWFEVASRIPDSGFPRSDDFHPRHLEDDRKRAVRWVANDRRRALPRSGERMSDRIEGRLLSFAPDETLSDGAAESVSQGFFNVENEPPWDLWLGWVVEKSDRPREYLVCWVPSNFVQAAADGIEVNPEVCIDWLPELEQALGLEPSASS
jgi:hypothetical protein